jgi:hypothetical protein
MGTAPKDLTILRSPSPARGRAALLVLSAMAQHSEISFGPAAKACAPCGYLKA